MRILWSAVSLLVVAALALLLWNAASGTDRVEVVRDGVTVSGTPGPEPSPGTVRRAEDPASASPSATDSSGAAQSPPEEGAGGPAGPAAPVPPAEQPPVPPAVPAPPAQVPLPVQPAPPGDDWDDDLDDDWDDDLDDDWDD